MESNYEALEKTEGAAAREQIVADLKALTRDAEDLIKATAGDVSEKAKATRERLAAALERAKATCAKVQDQTVAAAKKADTVIRDHPYESIGISFGLGALIGWLVTRK